MNSIILLYTLTLILSIIFGAIARKTEFCPLGGIADVLKTGNNGRFFMYLFAIGIAILWASLLEGFSILSFDTTRPPYRSYEFRWSGYIAGGFLFGIGMTLSRGCGMKNMLNLGGGDMRAAIALLGISMASYVLLYTDGMMDNLFGWVVTSSPDLSQFDIYNQDLGSFAHYFFSESIGGSIDTWRIFIGLAIAAFFIGLALRSRYFKERKNNRVGGFTIGTLIIAAFYLTGGSLRDSVQEISDFMSEPLYGLGMQSYTFIRPMGDTLRAFTHPVLYFVTLGLVMSLGIGLGSLLYSLFDKSFKVQGIKILTSPRYFIGGLLMGTGGVLGLGCTLGQGMAGTSTLALGSFMTLTFIVLGAYIGIKLQSNFMDDHEVPK